MIWSLLVFIISISWYMKLPGWFGLLWRWVALGWRWARRGQRVGPQWAMRARSIACCRASSIGSWFSSGLYFFFFFFLSFLSLWRNSMILWWYILRFFGRFVNLQKLFYDSLDFLWFFGLSLILVVDVVCRSRFEFCMMAPVAMLDDNILTNDS